MPGNGANGAAGADETTNYQRWKMTIRAKVTAAPARKPGRSLTEPEREALGQRRLQLRVSEQSLAWLNLLCQESGLSHSKQVAWLVSRALCSSSARFDLQRIKSSSPHRKS